MQDYAPSAGTARNGIGALLRDAREQRGIDIEGVARALRIRQPYLVAIEEGRFKDLPGAPYAGGFVRSYAEFLSLDATEILRRFREESGGAGARSELIFPAPVSEGGFPAAVLILVVVIIAAAVYGVWYFYQWRHGGSAESVSELPDRLAALIHPPGGEAGAGGTMASSAAAKSPSQAMAGSPAETAAPSAQFQAVKPDLPQARPAPSLKSWEPPSLASTPSPAPTSAPAPIVTASAGSVATAPATTEPTPAAVPTAAAPAPVQTPTVASAPAPTPAQAATEPAPPSAPVDVADATPPPTVATSVSPPPAPEFAPPSRVVLRATDECWIEIRDASGEVVISRLLHRGDAFPVPPRPGETLTVGNAGAIALLLDGNPLPPLGKAGMVRHDVPIDPERLTGQVPNPAPAAAPAAPAAPAAQAND